MDLQATSGKVTSEKEAPLAESGASRRSFAGESQAADSCMGVDFHAKSDTGAGKLMDGASMSLRPVMDGKGNAALPKIPKNLKISKIYKVDKRFFQGHHIIIKPYKKTKIMTFEKF